MNHLHDLKDLHKNRSAILIGSGPSIIDDNTMDIIKRLVSEEKCLLFGTNHVLHLQEIIFDYVIVIDQDAHAKLKSKGLYNKKVNEALILGGKNYENINDSDIQNSIICLPPPNHKNILSYKLPTRKHNLQEVLKYVGHIIKASSMFVTLQLVLYTGVSRIYLAGIDCTDVYGSLNQNAFKPEYSKLIKGWVGFKNFVNVHYPHVEILSINPVGLKDVFKEYRL